MKILLQKIVPQHLLSRLIAKITECRIPWLKNLYIHSFIKKYDVNTEEVKKNIPEDFATFNEFFIRQLDPECRPFSEDENILVSPVDGTVSEFGTIDDETLLQAKGQHYSLQRLLANRKSLVNTFKNGSYMTFYLSPRDYHRVHIPCKGNLKKMTYVPGKLFSVNQKTTQAIPDIFSRNERVIALFETAFGPMAVIFVGACLVAGIHTRWHGQVTPAKNKNVHSWHYDENNTIAFDKADELGYFQFGSTVILLFPENTVHWNNELNVGTSISMGNEIGQILP